MVCSRRGKKSFSLAAVATATALVLLVPAGPAFAKKPPMTFTGSITCTFTGTLKFKPALINTDTPSTTTVTLKGKLRTCSYTQSQSTVVITKGSIKATATAPSNNCATDVGPDSRPLPAMDATVKWKATGGKASPSSIDYSGVSVIPDQETGYLDLYFPQSGGTSPTTGSFAGSSSPASASSNQVASILAKACNPRKHGKPAKGIKAIAFGVAESTIGTSNAGTITLGS